MTDSFLANLARFDDSLTMRHTRTYPHPIERVWQAISSTEHINRWLLPTASVEAVEGGRCSFTWGGDTEQVGVVREVDPPRRIVYDLDTSYLRFELEAIDGGTRLVLFHGFAPGAHVEVQDFPGGDQPAGPSSPWRPSFSQGFHVMLDALAISLEGTVAEDDNVLAWLARTGGNDPELIHERDEIYRQHIRDHCPPA